LGIWEFKKLFFVIVAVTLLSTGVTGISGDAFADKKIKNTTKIIHLGTLQIAAHDFYNFDRCGDNLACAIENEDHLLNLSTVLFDPKSGDCTFEDAIDEENVECEMRTDGDIRIGGEIRNRENILIFTAASELGEKYLQLADKHGEEKAYDKILKKYHKELKKAFKETFHLKWPKPQSEGEITNDHNSALRSVHDMLPGEIIMNGEIVSVFQDPFFSVPEEKLSKKDRKQPSGPLDGLLDPAFLPFCPFPGFCINLLDADVTFADVFTNTDFNQLMIQTSDGKYDKDEQVTQLIIEQFAIGINLP
jgi:hypothetical protein